MDGFDFKKLNHEVDDLLSDVRELLDDGEQTAGTDGQPAESAPDAPELPDESVKSADDVHIDYRKFYGEEPGNADAASDETVVFRPLTAYEQSRPAYQTARRAAYERAREQERLARERERLAREQEEERIMRRMESEQKRRRGRKAPAMDEQAYSDWLYEQGDGEATRAQREAASQFFANGEQRQDTKRKKRRTGVGWKILIVLLMLVIGTCAGVHFLWARQPAAKDGLGARRDGCSTILIAGTDKGGYRTDTMMLLTVDREAGTLSLVSIPRDTLVYCEYAVPKINSAYGFAGGGEAGMQELLKRVGEIIGFVPDGYVVLDLAAFEQLVDLMGGVEFDVPMDMYYSDPSQELFIDLKAGEQKLTGEQAMQLVRFRSGYATADLGRVDVQRQFVSAALDQWLSVKNICKAPAALKLLMQSSQSSLTSANYIWLAETALVCDRANIQTRTLPGEAMYIAGGSYYVLDAVGVAQTVNECCNPYEQGVAVSDLYIRVG